MHAYGALHTGPADPIFGQKYVFFFKKMTRPSMESFSLYIKLIYAKVSKNSGK